MKNIVLLIALFASFMAMADIGPVGRSTEIDGTGAFKGPHEKFYINVKNVSGGTLQDGDVVVLDTTELDGYSVNTSTTAGAVPHCVLALKPGNSSCADDELCRCQTFGIHSNVNFDDTNAEATAGFLVFHSENNAGYIQGEAKGSVAASDYPVGVFLESSTTSGDLDVFIRLR